MIVLDAGVVIALVDADDAHHASAEKLFSDHIDEVMTIGPINLAEVLVRAARDGRDEEMLADLRRLGISTTELPDGAGPQLARLRARTAAKMPDCCVLLAAEQTGGQVATFDERLGKIAISLGLGVVGVADRHHAPGAPFVVRTVPWERGWELHIEGEGVTDVGTLDQAAARVCDYLMSLHPDLTVHENMIDIRADEIETT